MKTLPEIKSRAYAIAETHFYADIDDGQPWEPFENYPKQWIKNEIKHMAEMLIGQMLWAQSQGDQTE